MEKFIERETEKAYLVRVKIENCIIEKVRIEKVWIPKSAIHIEEKRIGIDQWVIRKNIIQHDGDMFIGFAA